MNRFLPKTWNLKALGIAVALSTSIALAGLVPWAIDPNIMNGGLKRSVLASSGFVIHSHGPARVSLFPWPSLRITDAVLESQQTKEGLSTRIEASQVRVRLNLYALATGRGAISELKLYQPRITLADNTTPDQLTSIFKALKGLMSDTAGQSLRRLTIGDGTLDIDGARVLNSMSVTVNSQPSFGRTMTGTAQFGQTRFDLNADLGAGLPAAAFWSLRSDAFAATFSGRQLGAESLDADGDLSLSWSDGGQVARQLGLDETLTNLSSKMDLTGKARLLLPTLQLRDATVNLDKSTFAGAVDVSFGQSPPRLSATLATDHLVLPGWTWKRIASNQTMPAGEPVRQVKSLRGNADIRLSAARVSFGDIALGESAFSLSSRQDRMEAILNQTTPNGGTIKARSFLSATQNQVRNRTTVTADRVPADLVGAILNIPLVSGTLSATLTHEGMGIDGASIFVSGAGNGTVQLVNGDIRGVDLGRLFARGDKAQNEPLPPTGITRIQSGTAKVQLVDGKIVLEDGLLRNPLLRAPFEGTFDLTRDALDITMRILPPIDISRLGEARLLITGPLSKPAIKHEWRPQPGRT